MTLEDLLKPLKFLDEQVLIQYTKLTNYWESKGKSKYTLAAAFSFGSFGLFANPPLQDKSITIDQVRSNFSDLEISLATFGIYSYVVLLGHDMAYYIMAPFEKRMHQKSGIAIYPFTYISSKIQRATRLIILGLAAYAFKDFVKSFYYDNNITDLWASGVLFTLASSMYIKDTDTKLLDKKPFWKNVYDYVKGKFNMRIPQPIAVK